MVGVSERKDDLTPGRIEEIKKKLNINNIYALYGTTECFGSAMFKDTFSFWELLSGDIDEKYLKHAIDDNILIKTAPYDFEALYLMIREGQSRREFEIRKNIYLKLLKFWNTLILEEKITDVIFARIPHESPTYTLYIMCKVYNIRMCMGDNMTMYDLDSPRSIMLKDIYYNDKWLIQKRNAINMYSEGELCLTPGVEKLYNDMTLNLEKKPEKTMFSFESRAGQIERYFGNQGHAKLDFSGLTTPKEYLRKIVWWLYHKLYADIKYKDPTEDLIKYYNSLAKEADFTKKYIYVPLHYSPECTSNPQGGNIYGEMVLILDILSEALPDDVLIYAKEHPAQTAFGRYKEFYDRCLEIKNVVLIKEDTSLDDLLRNCIAVSTITGTTGYEAQYYGKPFLMFGYYISKYAPGTICVRTVEDCRKAYGMIEKKQLTWDLQDIKRYLKFVEEVSYADSEISDEDFAGIVANILESEY